MYNNPQMKMEPQDLLNIQEQCHDFPHVGSIKVSFSGLCVYVTQVDPQ